MSKVNIEPNINNNSTQKEIEALAASKSAELRDRDRKLSEDKEREKKREERNKRIRRWLGIIGIVLILALVLVQCSNMGKLELPERVKNIIEADKEDTVSIDELEKTPEEQRDFMYSHLRTSMAKTVKLENGLAEGYFNIINNETNVYNQLVEIYTIDAEGNLQDLIYKSGIIEIGQVLPYAKLSANLPAGTYSCVAHFLALDTETNEHIGTAGVRITVEVANTATE